MTKKDAILRHEGYATPQKWFLFFCLFFDTINEIKSSYPGYEINNFQKF